MAMMPLPQRETAEISISIAFVLHVLRYVTAEVQIYENVCRC